MGFFKTAIGDLLDVEETDGVTMAKPVAAEEILPYDAVVEASTKNAVTPQTSVILANTFIRGEIVSEGNVTIAGGLEGNISAKGNVRVSGTITGNVDADRVDLSAGTVNGNVTAAQSVSLDSASSISGDVSANVLNSDGNIQGEVNVRGDAIFLSRSRVEGHISAGTISVEKGAKLKGTVHIIEENEPAPFNDYVEDLFKTGAQETMPPTVEPES